MTLRCVAGPDQRCVLLNTLRRRPAIAYIAEASLLIFDTAFFIGILHAHSMFPGFKTFASNSLFFLSTPVLSSGFPPA